MATELDRQTPLQRPRRIIRFGRSRLSWLLLSLAMAVSAGLGVYIQRHSSAATTTVVSGRVTDAVSKYGIPNVTLSLCHNISVVTNANGEWSISLPEASSICVMYTSGAPSAVVSSSAVNLPATASRRDIYEYQVTAIDCWHNTGNVYCYANAQNYDRAVDSGYDLVFTLATPYIPPPPTPPPSVTPVPPQASAAPTAAPAITLQAPKQHATPVVVTPKPGATPVPGTVAADAQAPTVPGNFKAASTQSNAVVNLAWDSSGDNVGVIAYEIDRSVNSLDWTAVNHHLDRPGYEDTDVAYGLTYTYRIRALDAKGNASGYAISQVRTPAFVQNSSNDATSVYTSDDSAAAVSVPAASFGKSAQCSVVLGGYNNLRLDSGSAIMAGPYQLICKDAEGTIITKFLHPVTWTVTPRTSDLKLSAPKPYSLTSDGRPVPLTTGVTYDNKLKSYRFAQTSNEKVIVLAAQQSSTVVVLVIMGVSLVILLIAGVTFFSLQRKRLTTYRDYLRDKYYNL